MWIICMYLINNILRPALIATFTFFYRQIHIRHFKLNPISLCRRHIRMSSCTWTCFIWSLGLLNGSWRSGAWLQKSNYRNWDSQIGGLACQSHQLRRMSKSQLCCFLIANMSLCDWDRGQITILKSFKKHTLRKTLLCAFTIL